MISSSDKALQSLCKSRTLKEKVAGHLSMGLTMPKLHFFFSLINNLLCYICLFFLSLGHEVFSDNMEYMTELQLRLQNASRMFSCTFAFVDFKAFIHL